MRFLLLVNFAEASRKVEEENEMKHFFFFFFLIMGFSFQLRRGMLHAGFHTEAVEGYFELSSVLGSSSTQQRGNILHSGGF